MATELRAPLMVPRDLICGGFGADAIIRTERPETIRSGTLPQASAEQLATLTSYEVSELRGKHCSSGCRTRDHLSYGQCLKAKATGTYLAAPSRGLDGSTQKRWDSELDRYYEARREGIQPDGTTMPKVMEAIKLSDQAGAAYGRDFSKATPFEGE